MTLFGIIVMGIIFVSFLGGILNVSCQAFVQQRSTTRSAGTPARTKRGALLVAKAYAFIDHDHDDGGPYVHPEVVSRVQPDSRIKQWNPPSPPSYMRQQQQQQEAAAAASDQQVTSANNNNNNHDHLWDDYMTVSEETVQDPNELNARLTETAPVQPSTPTPEEFAYATIKDWVYNGGGPHQHDMAAPDEFEQYMTVTDAPATFMDAVVENNAHAVIWDVQAVNDYDDSNDESSWTGY